MAKTIGVAEARDTLSEMVNRAAFSGERYVVERRGKPLAALISSEEYRQLVDLLTEKGVRDEVHGMPVQLHLEGDHYVVSSDELDLYGVGHTPQEAREDYLIAARESYADLAAHADRLSRHLEAHLARLRQVFCEPGGEA
jgi:prevent-host-death family protein